MTNHEASGQEPPSDDYLVAFFAEQFDNSIETPLPNDRDGWRSEVRRLLEVREAYRRKFPDQDVLRQRPDFNFLLGQLSVALRESAAHDIAELLSELPDTPPGS